jgi:hypothetical protein
MAVSINTVYQKVLAIANKEQRGYITPQEFNLFANQAQMDIFEQYFYDINQFGRVLGNSTEYSDMLNLLEEKISIFDQFKVSMSAVSGNQLTLPIDVYRLGTVFYAVGGAYDVEVEKVSKKNLEYMSRTALYAPVETRPVYTKKSETLLKLFPASPSTSYTTGNVTCNYIKKPATVKWTYTVVVGKALYNASAVDLQDFELHASEENNLVLKILQLAGVSIKDPSIYQIAAQEEVKDIQQEKQ